MARDMASGFNFDDVLLCLGVRGDGLVCTVSGLFLLGVFLDGVERRILA